MNCSNLLGEPLEIYPNSNVSFSNDLGFRLGVLADYTVSKNFSISPKAELSLNNSTINLTQADGSVSEFDVMPISLEFMTHFIVKKNNKKLKPYLTLGPNFKIPISIENDVPKTTLPTKSFLAFDFGIGMNKSYTYFNLSPEIIYSFGLMNIDQNAVVNSLNFHNISLVFNFMG